MMSLVGSETNVDNAGSIPVQQTVRALEIGMLWGNRIGTGGLDRIYTDLCGALPKEGVDVTGIVIGPPGVEAETGGRVRRVPSDARLKAMRYLATRSTIDQTLRSVSLDLVSIHFALHGAVALDRLRRQPIVMHFHGPWSGEAELEGESRLAVAVKRSIERAVYVRAQRVIVLSYAFGDLAVRKFGIRKELIRVVPGHVDLDRFAPLAASKAEARRMLSLPADRPLLLTVRRLQRRMGLENLIDSLALVARAVPDVLLCVGGSGPLAGLLRQRADALGLTRNVEFLGFVPDDKLALAYQAADINVVPSTGLEGFGLVAAEALAAGTPSMVTPVGGLPEVVATLSPDLVFASVEARDIAEALVAGLHGSITLPDAAACRRYAARSFPLDLAAKRTADVYREVLA